jgi:hypothetical protein
MNMVDPQNTMVWTVTPHSGNLADNKYDTHID